MHMHGHAACACLTAPRCSDDAEAGGGVSGCANAPSNVGDVKFQPPAPTAVSAGPPVMVRVGGQGVHRYLSAHSQASCGGAAAAYAPAGTRLMGAYGYGTVWM